MNFKCTRVRQASRPSGKLRPWFLTDCWMVDGSLELWISRYGGLQILQSAEC